ncbi:DUF5597 domain-containing protein [uncultured Microbacterium sp.]|uniref:Glycoside hydrolase n=1 Tax=uncultured Microbacterium sp. TaxID=191216 RepID=A0A1Y5NYM9_9MICO|nr:DUF5597 domain-containing protein [uncultured Microbacterium sp.]SBS71494.1 Glycoside hydrolase [uncultured Microbacterium sp.]
MTENPVPAARPWSIGDGAGLRRDGVPALLVGGQVFNSSSSSPRAIGQSFAHVRRMNGNVVLAPVSWALTEPVEGAFDFALVDRMIEEARHNELRLVLLWFGAYKNAASTYAPRWVRADTERFPRAVVESVGRPPFSYAGETAKPVLSVFGRELRESDAAAFEALVRHLVQADPGGVVAMLQVENESGLLGDSRDRSADAAAAWAGPVPAQVIARLPDAPDGASSARTLWEARGSRTSGSWAEVFGESSAADEVFMAWAFADYVEHIARRGRAIADIPMFANAWLGPQPGQDEPGQYPSGGPASRVLDVWRGAAPSLSLLGPDIYVEHADAVMRDYAAGGHPFFVPESRLSAGELVRAVGTYRAFGWSGFGVDGANPDGQVAATLAFLAALEGQIAEAQLSGRIGAAVVETGVEVVRLHLGGIHVDARGTLALLQTMLLDAGVSVPVPGMTVPDETLPDAPVQHRGDTRPFGLVFAVAEDTVIVIGRELTLDFFADDARIEIDAVEELLVEDGEVTVARVLNGDERLRIVPTERVGAARIRLVRV